MAIALSERDFIKETNADRAGNHTHPFTCFFEISEKLELKRENRAKKEDLQLFCCKSLIFKWWWEMDR